MKKEYFFVNMQGYRNRGINNSTIEETNIILNDEKITIEKNTEIQENWFYRKKNQK